MNRHYGTEFFIPVLLGTARKGRKSEGVAKFVHAELAKVSGVRTELVDVQDYLLGATVPDDGEHPRASAWRKIAAEADGFIIVSPEYNRGYPGELKQLLDCAYHEYEKKPVGLVGVSNGRFGGSSMLSLIQPTLVELGLIVLRGAVRVSNSDALVDEMGNVEGMEVYNASLAKLFDSILWYARALANARAKDL